jgi:spore coat protein SA
VTNLKIALICTEKLPVPPVAGGAVQLYIEGILPYLSKHHDITVFSIEDQRLPKEEIKDNVKYLRVQALSANKYIQNVKQLLGNSFDLVHVFNRPKWVLTLSKDLPKTKFSLSLHNEMFVPDKITEVQALECIKRVEFINTVSKFIADGVESLYPAAKDKLNVIYSGADSNIYKPNWTDAGKINRYNLKEKYNLTGKKVVLFVSRLSPKKGPHILMKAMIKVAEKHPDTALVIVGSKWYGKNEIDEYTKSLQALVSSMNCPIIFTGFLPPSEIPALYNIGDIFICSSQWNEPLARVHYEAMAAGLPIITTNRGGNAEVVPDGENGLIIDDFKNSDSFAEKINYLLDNPALASEMGHKGRLMAEQKYNWQRVAQDVQKQFSKVEVITQTPNKLEKTDVPKPFKISDTVEPKKDSFFSIDF